MNAGRGRLMTLVAAAVLAAAVSAAAGAERVAGVLIEGNQRVETAAIRSHVHVQVGEALDRRTIDRDIKEIYELGFFDHVWVTSEPAPDGVHVTYHVAERPYVTDLAFDGVKHVEREDLEAVVNIVPGSIFDSRRRVSSTVEKDTPTPRSSTNSNGARAILRSSITTFRRDA